MQEPCNISKADILAFVVPVTTEFRWKCFLDTSATGLQLLQEAQHYIKVISGFVFIEDPTFQELQDLQHELVEQGLDTYKV